MALAHSPYAVDRSRLARGRGIVPILEQKQRQRPKNAGSSTTSGPGSANIPMPQLSQLSQLQQSLSDQVELVATPKQVVSPKSDGERNLEPQDQSPPEPSEQTIEAGNEEMEHEEPSEEEKDGVEKWPSQEEMQEPASRLPKPTEVSQNDGKIGAPRAKSSSKSGNLTRSPHMQGLVGTSKPKRSRSAEKPAKFVFAQPARRIPQRVPTSPETRDIASSPMSPISPMPANTLQSESISGLFRELGTLRDDFIAAKLDSERGRERIHELEGENAQLRKQLQEAEKQKRKLLQEKKELEHSSDLWRQRWEDSQQQLEECWKRFDALKVVKEEERPPDKNAENVSSKSSVAPSPLSGACQVELSSPTHDPAQPLSSLSPVECREVQDPPVAVEVTSVASAASEDSRAQPKSAVAQPTAPSACGTLHSIQQIQSIGFQTPPVSGVPLSVPALSPRTMPARSTFPSPRTQQALRVVSVPTGAANVYFSSQLPAQVASPMGDYRRQSVPARSSRLDSEVVFTTAGSLPSTVIQSPRTRTAL